MHKHHRHPRRIHRHRTHNPRNRKEKPSLSQTKMIAVLDHYARRLNDAQPHDQIIFDPTVFPPEQPVTINLASNLPEIAQGSLTIDASNAGVILNGSEIPAEDSNGINISSNNNIIRGLQIIDFSGWGIALYNGAQNNLIGGDNEIGNGLLGQGNLVSGNRASGILLWGEKTSYNIIQGNYIGTDVNGTLVRNSQPEGIFIGGGSHNEILHNLIANHKWGGITLRWTRSRANPQRDRPWKHHYQ